MINPIYYLSNRNGIPRIKSVGVSVNGTTNVQYTFNSDNYFSNYFSGLILVKFEQSIPTGTTSTLPIVFTSANGGTQALTTFNGDAVTVANISGTGIILCYYDRASGVLQMLTGIN